jgi:threonine aldolase
VLALRHIARPGDAVICAATAHINADEAGAAEAIAGVKLLPVDTNDGKLTPELAANPIRAVRPGDPHSPQPRAVSISQATELGTVYTPAEVRALADFAHSHDMLLHVDGARLANAAAHLELPLAATTTDAGADFLSFGGTKNGLLAGEAVIFLRPELGARFQHTRMQGTQLASKMRFLAAQFDALLSADLWQRNAAHANAMAAELARRLREIDAVILPFPIESNAVFAVLPAAAIEPLRAALPGDLPFHSWGAEDAGLIRLMCSWDTTAEDIDQLAGAIADAVAG